MSEAGSLLGELRPLIERLPLPHPLWHRYVPLMHEVVADATAALAALETLPAARAELRRQLEGDGDYPPDDAGGPAIAAARLRLRELPVPQGEHPYLDEILLALEAAEAVLAALAAAGGDGAFARESREPEPL